MEKLIADCGNSQAKIKRCLADATIEALRWLEEHEYSSATIRRDGIAIAIEKIQRGKRGIEKV